MTNEELINEFKQILPALFPGTQLDALTSNSIRWRSIQNKRSVGGVIPESCFKHSGSRKILIVRDEFIPWWVGTLK